MLRRKHRDKVTVSREYLLSNHEAVVEAVAVAGAAAEMRSDQPMTYVRANCFEQITQVIGYVALIYEGHATTLTTPLHPTFSHST